MPASAPSGAIGQRFDLQVEAQRADRGARNSRIVLAACGAIFALIGLLLLLTAHPATAAIAGAILFWALAAVMFGIGRYVGSKAPLVALTITDAGVGLVFEDRAEQQLAWSDPGFGLTFRDFTSDSAAIDPEERRISLQSPKGRSGLVTIEVVAATVSAARAHGLPVLVRPEVVGGKHPRKTTATRIGTPEHTPGWYRTDRPGW